MVVSGLLYYESINKSGDKKEKPKEQELASIEIKDEENGKLIDQPDKSNNNKEV